MEYCRLTSWTFACSVAYLLKACLFRDQLSLCRWYQRNSICSVWIHPHDSESQCNQNRWEHQEGRQAQVSSQARENQHCNRCISNSVLGQQLSDLLAYSTFSLLTFISSGGVRERGGCILNYRLVSFIVKSQELTLLTCYSTCLCWPTYRTKHHEALHSFSWVFM